MSFSLAEELRKQLGDVSGSDTGQERITYIDMDQLDDDPDNFYAMTSIPELASNISLCGLQQPVRVRPGAEGRYTIVSGHRRRAAMKYLVTVDGIEKYRKIPCIVEHESVSSAMRELRLIYANSGTRRLTDAELSLQAVKVEELLYQLKEEGVEFPGRMRDQVAAACQASATKLAELKVIREQLQEPFQGQFQRGELNRSGAYALARLPKDIQKDLDLALGAKYKIQISGAAVNLLERAEKYYDVVANQTCPDGSGCKNLLGMLRATAAAPYSWHHCEGKCCINCYSATSCKGKCAEAKRQEKLDREKEARRQEKQKSENAKRSEAYKVKSAANAKRLLPLIEAAGLGGKEKLRFDYGGSDVAQVRRYAEQGGGDDYLYGELFKPQNIQGLCEMAVKLNCTTDFLLGLTEEPRPAEPPEGQLTIAGYMPAGTNPGRESGLCVCMMQLDPDKEPAPMLLYWDGAKCEWQFKHGAAVEQEPVGWMRLPEWRN